MKKLLLIIPILLLSCTKESKINSTTNDSLSIFEEPIIPEFDSVSYQDSLINNAEVTKKVIKEGVMRKDKGSQIVRVVDASALPFTIGEEFDEGHDELLIKIKDVSQESISIDVTPENRDMNIRVNQIKLSNGVSDGPFGRFVDQYYVKDSEEVIVIIGRSNMSSEKDTGSFKVFVQ